MEISMSVSKIKKELRALADPAQAKVLSGFFKTGPGQYGAGDRFLGIKVPAQRAVARKYGDLPLYDAAKLLHSKIHEERLVSLMILIEKYAAGTTADRDEIIRTYLSNTAYVNNWDLVDLSAPPLLGRHLYGGDTGVLDALARSDSLWERRIAIVATHYFIRNGEVEVTMRIAAALLNDTHDLIHKAVGWMLREAGKKNMKAEWRFLDEHAARMPRTMLRYAIEKFQEKTRRAYLEQGR
jgi:3-methyladenine DNA glycosylase AlkD